MNVNQVVLEGGIYIEKDSKENVEIVGRILDLKQIINRNFSEVSFSSVTKKAIEKETSNILPKHPEFNEIAGYIGYEINSIGAPEPRPTSQGAAHVTPVLYDLVKYLKL